MSETSYWKILTRRKPFKDLNENISNNGRVLNIFELTGLGIGATIGVGVYVLVGHVARDLAGPSAILSFLIAAIASLLAGLSYAEFGSRIPRSGSSYLYTFTILGEFIAFIIGWNLIFEYIIGSAAAARAISLYLDAVTDNLFKTTFLDKTPINTSFLAEYFDLLALSIPIILSIGLALGLRKSTIINNIFTIINLFLILFIIITGSIKSDPKNWQIDSTTIPAENNAGEGGFFPYGFEGTLHGAAISLFAYIGIDYILTSGEKVANPKRSIPNAIIFSLLIICIVYVCISTVLTLMLPYYLHDINTPLANVFVVFGWEFAKWFVVIGGIFALLTGLFGGMFALPKILYDMVTDGLIFQFLGKINTTFKTPVSGILISGLLTGLMSALFNLQQLVSMMSIGTLLAFTIVSLSVMILRFTEDLEEEKTIKSEDEISVGGFIIQIFNCKCSKPSKLSMIVVRVLAVLFCIISLTLSLIIKFTINEIQNMEVWAVSLSGGFLGILLLILLGISVQPRPKILQPYFKVPLVPLIPAVSIFVNIYLMLMLDVNTWIRFGAWMIIGLAVYLTCMFFKDKDESNIVKKEVVDPYIIEAKIEPEMQEIQKSSIPNERYSTDETKIFGNNNDEDEDRAPTPETINSPVITSNGISSKKTKSRAPPTPVSTKADENVQTKGFEFPEPDETIKISTPTSSSKSSYDEIILASEASSVLTEKKEPNGKAYFVEEVSKSPDPFQRKSYEDKETSFALAFLDDVLQTEETENEETIAVVHNSDEGEQSREESPVPSPSPPPPPPPPPPPMYSPVLVNNIRKVDKKPLDPVVSYEPLKTEEEQNYSTEEDRLKFGSKKQKQFMDRLSILIAGGETPLKPKTVFVKNKDPPNDDSVIVTDRPVLRHSKSEPFLPSLLLNEIKSRNPDNTKSPEIEVVIPEPPKFDEELFNNNSSSVPSPLPIVPVVSPVNEVETPENVSEIIVEDEVVVSNIPEPPKFDEELFKTLDKKYSVFVPNQSPTLSTPRPRLKSIPTVEVPKAVDTNKDEEEELSKTSIKNKLEAIFKKGPPPRIGLKKPPPEEALPKKSSTPVNQKEEEKIEVRTPTKPDTLGRRKILFNDVLKSIKPDTRPSVIRNDSMKKSEHPDNITDF